MNLVCWIYVQHLRDTRLSQAQDEDLLRNEGLSVMCALSTGINLQYLLWKKK